MLAGAARIRKAPFERPINMTIEDAITFLIWPFLKGSKLPYRNTHINPFKNPQLFQFLDHSLR